MRCPTFAQALTVAVMSFGLTSLAGETGQNMRDWSHLAPIRLEEIPSKGVVEFALTPEVFDIARTDMGDLRVYAGTGREIPYVLRVGEGRTRTATLGARVYNLTCIPGQQSSVTVDFGAKVVKNRIDVLTSGTNFRRGILVEGGDDGIGWQEVRQGAFIFRVARDATVWGYDKETVALPDNDQRYLRVTVYNAPDDPKRIEIRDVRASHVIREEANTAPVPVRSTEVVQNEKERMTEIAFDIGYRNLPLHVLKLRIADENFFRRVSVYARNQKERVLRTPVEEGPPREKVVPEPWVGIGKGAIYRYSSGGATDELLTLGLKGARARHLRLCIENLDNPPLGFEGGEVTRMVHYLAFKPELGTTFALYCGNASADRPSYDIVHYIGRLRGEGVTQAILGETAPNPVYGPKEVIVPWSERYKWVIWVALLAVAVVLGSLIYRQVKRAPASQ